MAHLTDDALREIIESGKYPTEIWDRTPAGLGVRIGIEGEAEFVLRYSLRSLCPETRKPIRAQHEQIVGVWDAENPNPDWKLYNVDMARGQASYLLLQAKRNIDPFADDAEVTGSRMRFADYLEEFLKRHAHEKNLAPRTVSDYRMMLDKDILPQLGDIPLFKLDRHTIAKFHRELSVARPHPDRPNRQRGGRTRANRQLALIKTALARAVEWGYLDTNPARFVKKYKEKPRDIWGTEEDLVRLLSILERDLRTGSWRYRNAIDGIRLALLTGARKQELRLAERKYFEFRQSPEGEIALWRKPPEITKSKQWEVTTLHPLAVKIVRARFRDCAESKWLFPSRYDPSKPVHDFEGWHRYKKLAGCEHLHFHDLRHTATTHAVMSGANLYTISKGLDHKSVKTTERYTHADLRAKAEAASHFGRNMARWVRNAADFGESDQAASMQERKFIGA
ncbi:tyrosine-type recombinase/integrase [Pacificispira sp.]|uniref:tyrosine-type recombinase/integrase n=1 Tax=Pacificispira sp. TaxID=2888761 RepID=UPI003B51B957